MSYILEALKKAQAERQLGNAPTIHAPAISAAPQAGGGRGPLLIGFAAGAVLVAGALFAWRHQPAQQQVADAGRAAEPVAAASQPVAPHPAAGIQPVVPNSAAASQPAPAPDVASQPPPAPAVASQPAAAPAVKPSAADTGAQVALVQEPAAAVHTSDGGAKHARPQPAPQTKIAAPEVTGPAVPVPAGAPKVAEPVAPPAASRNVAAQNAAPPAAAPAVAARQAPAPAAPSADDTLRTLNELPESIRFSVPKVAFGGYMYSPNPADRLVLVDKALRREGEELAPGLVLEKLLPKAAVLNYRGYRYRVPL